MNGTQRHIALGFAAVFVGIVLLVMVANALSTISDLDAAGARIAPHLIWSWEWSSTVGWLSLYPVLWWAVARFRPPRLSWVAAIAVLLAGSVVASAWHIGVMVALRRLYYAATGNGPYHFFGTVGDRLLYEYRKDLVTLLQFTAATAMAQWLIARAGAAPSLAVVAPRVLAVQDGAVTHRLPVDEIEQVGAASNYVEISWRGRTLLHRATLAAIEAELGEAFVRIHRSRLVRRAAIRRVAVDKSGDFAVTLESGAQAQGSRRYRVGLDGDRPAP